MRLHAASLQINRISWQIVITALFSANRYSDGISLFHHWISALSSDDKSKPISRRLLPDPDTYVWLVRSVDFDGSHITPELAMKQLDQYQVKSNTDLHNLFVKTVVGQGRHHAALMWWGDKYERGIILNSETVSSLITIINYYETVSDNKNKVDELVQLVWDRCINAVTKKPHPDWYVSIFMPSFHRQNDLHRTLQMVDALSTYPYYSKWSRAAALATSIESVLQHHNYVLSDEYATFENWPMSTVK